MAAKEIPSGILLVSSLLVFSGVVSPVSALKDSQFIDRTQDSAYDDTEVREKDLPVLLLGYLLTGHGKMSSEGMAEAVPSYHTNTEWTAKETTNLTPLLNKLLASLSGHQQVASLSSGKSRDDGYEVMVSKRGSESLSGVMPPLNEFCRMMKVQCY